ncbi:DMT family transporter [Gynuella sp.]|uniref:DMT family transporter n=1 Tax=Gynuella sp. TaxID=2969146 RepID=UPI003D0A2C4B
MTGSFFIMMACLTWALDTLIRYPLLGEGYNTLQIVMLEHLFLSILFSPLLWLYRKRWLSLSPTQWLGFIVIGGFGSAIGNLAFTQAFQFLHPTVVILLQKLQPIVAITLAYLWLKEPIKKGFAFWAMIVFAGSFIMIWPDISTLFGSVLHYNDQISMILLGYALTLVAVLAWGSATVFGKYLSLQGLKPQEIMTGRFTTGFIVLLPIWLLQDHSTIDINWSLSGKVLGMVLISGLAGMALYYQGLRRVGARVATLAEMTFPVAAVVVNWAFLDSPLNLYQIAGALILIAGNLGLRLKDSEQQESLQPQKA